jgi:hypothetical protein
VYEWAALHHTLLIINHTPVGARITYLPRAKTKHSIFSEANIFLGQSTSARGYRTAVAPEPPPRLFSPRSKQSASCLWARCTTCCPSHILSEKEPDGCWWRGALVRGWQAAGAPLYLLSTYPTGTVLIDWLVPFVWVCAMVCVRNIRLGPYLQFGAMIADGRMRVVTSNFQR